MQEAIFAAGCFWGVQFYFDQVPGVTETEAGYTGGHTDNPSYEAVCSHTTGHAEAVKITFDPSKVIAGDSKASTVQGAGEKQTESYIGYEEGASQSATPQRAASEVGVGGSAAQQDLAFRILLKQFFRMHDPTQLNRQGPDVGAQYRSAIFYISESQKQAARKAVDELDKSGRFKKPVATTLEAAGKWWPAEDYHQKFTERTGRGMCHVDYAPV